MTANAKKAGRWTGRWAALATMALVLWLVPAPSTAVASAKTAKIAPPSVVSVTATPRELRWGGGLVVVTAPVKRARACQLVLLSGPGLTVIFSHNPSQRCRGGHYSAKVVVGPNSSTALKTIMFKLVARNSTAGAFRTFRVLVAAHPLPPTTTTTTTVPAATTTTTSPPATTTTTIPAPPGIVVLPSTVSTTGSTSWNWAGYTLSGGPFTAVEGTFTVPMPTAAATCSELMNETVGIDGVTNSDILRAGVALSQLNPDTGKCVAGTNYVAVFWETSSGVEPITNVVVGPGDSITVVIWQVSPGTWAIELTDNTDTQSFSTTTPYSGPGSSAEWLLETPTDTSICGQGEDPSSPGICEVMPFSPAIDFSTIGVTGTIGQADDTVMQQNEGSATPSPLSNGGFSITYS